MNKIIHDQKNKMTVKQIRSLKFFTKAKRSCNICGNFFAAKSRYDRYCEECKANSEIYHHTEWATYS
jgi:hypothetical protein